MQAYTKDIENVDAKFAGIYNDSIVKATGLECRKIQELPLTEEQYQSLVGKTNVRVIDGELLYDEYKLRPSVIQLLGQTITDLELLLITRSG